MTVSNLSQAIHFIVQNDFLDNTELNPGDADEKLIEVIGESSEPSVYLSDRIPTNSVQEQDIEIH